MSMINETNPSCYRYDFDLLRAGILGLQAAQNDPLPHAVAEHKGRLKLSGKFVAERVSKIYGQTMTSSEVGRLLTGLGFEKRRATIGTRPILVVFDEVLCQRWLDELGVIEAYEVPPPQKAQAVPALPRYRRLKDMPLSDEQRAFVAEWLDYQLALVREWLLRE